MKVRKKLENNSTIQHKKLNILPRALALGLNRIHYDLALDRNLIEGIKVLG
ncbi:MAG TPA: hypothetical protein PKI34_12785 [Bacteroidales bacterium]|nr:hypothetical protein [Bacteroidales bacterium]